MKQKLAFIFPGQGSQQIGMLSAIAETYPQVETVFSQAAEVVNHDLWRIVKNGPEELLNRTDITQPVLLTVSVALWQVWRAKQG